MGTVIHLSRGEFSARNGRRPPSPSRDARVALVLGGGWASPPHVMNDSPWEVGLVVVAAAVMLLVVFWYLRSR